MRPLRLNLFILHQIISITALASVSPLGKDPELIWHQYLNPEAAITEEIVGAKNTLVAVLDSESKLAVKAAHPLIPPTRS